MDTSATFGRVNRYRVFLHPKHGPGAIYDCVFALAPKYGGRPKHGLTCRGFDPQTGKATFDLVAIPKAAQVIRYWDSSEHPTAASLRYRLLSALQDRNDVSA